MSSAFERTDESNSRRIRVEFSGNNNTRARPGSKLGTKLGSVLALRAVSKYPPLLREPVLLTGKEMLLDVLRLWGQKRAGEKEDEAQLPGIVE